MSDGTRRQFALRQPIHTVIAKKHCRYFGSGFRYYVDF